MKKVILMALAFAPVLAIAQTGKYVVDGKLGSINKGKVYLRAYVDEKIQVDSANIKDGAFHFEGPVGAEPIDAELIYNVKGNGPNATEHNYREVYLEQGNISITSKELLDDAKVEGSKTNAENDNYNALNKPINDAYSALAAKRKAASPEELKTPAFQKENSRAEKAIDEQSNAVSKKFIQDNPDSYVTLNALEGYAYGADYVDIAPLYNGLSARIKDTKAGKAFGERMPKIKAVALGAIAPEFTEADTSGNAVSLASFRGKYVLVDFWASWCGPCRRENPNIVRTFNAYKGQAFTILGVSLDQPNGKKKWLDAIHKDGLTWTHVSDLKGWKSAPADMYAVRGIPQNFLLDPNGKIIAKGLNGEELDAKLAEIFGKPAVREAGK